MNLVEFIGKFFFVRCIGDGGVVGNNCYVVDKFFFLEGGVFIFG